MRMSIAEARARNLLSESEAKALRQAGHQRGRGRTAQRRVPLSVCPIEGSTPQEKLWRGVCTRWPRQARWEYAGAVPGRGFRIDIAFPGHRLAVEVDGFQHHGKFKKDFQADRHRQNQFTLHGWRILRYFAGEIHGELDRILDEIAQALDR